MKKTILTIAIIAANTASYGQSGYSQPVREVANETTQAFQAQCVVSYQGSTTTGCTLITVPLGKRLVIKSASARCLGRSGDAFGPFSIWSNLYNQSSNSINQMRAFAPLSIVPGDGPFDSQRVGTMTLHQYADANRTAGATVTFTAAQNAPMNVTPRCEISMAGYLVDLP